MADFREVQSIIGMAVTYSESATRLGERVTYMYLLCETECCDSFGLQQQRSSVNLEASNVQWDRIFWPIQSNAHGKPKKGFRESSGDLCVQEGEVKRFDILWVDQSTLIGGGQEGPEHPPVGSFMGSPE